MPSFLFYLFATVLALCGLLVISMRNPVHSVLFLILAFFNAAALFILIGAEYLAMTLVIVYVGAVAVLFLFVIMMLDINFAEMRAGFLRYLPAGAVVAAIFFAELVAACVASLKEGLPSLEANANLSNTQALGNLLYTEYMLAFQLAGMILLVAMIGAIVLTHRQRPGVKRQKIASQVGRSRKRSVELVARSSGQGA
jgi:NADH-quinone oxidoreductase subunit J